MSDTKQTAQADPTTDAIAEVISTHHYRDVLGDYEIKPYFKWISCTGCDWTLNIAGMSGWRSWVAAHAAHVATEVTVRLSALNALRTDTPPNTAPDPAGQRKPLPEAHVEPLAEALAATPDPSGFRAGMNADDYREQARGLLGSDALNALIADETNAARTRERAVYAARVAALEDKWEQVRFYDVAAMQLRNSFIADTQALLNDEDTAALDATTLEAKRQMLRDARGVITQYLSTAAQWRYDRVCWAFAIMLGEIPEDSPEPLSPADEAEIARRAARLAEEQPTPG